MCIFTSCYSKNSFEVFSKYKSPSFVETGTYLGEGIELAIKAKYQNIYSIEINPKLYFFCKNKFENFRNVYLFQGDSSKKLWEIIRPIQTRITFWLDGHYSEGVKLTKRFSPIIAELNSIKRHPIKNHIIMIDDVRDFGTRSFDLVTLDEIISKIKEINPNYKIVFENCPTAKNDILVAYIDK